MRELREVSRSGFYRSRGARDRGMRQGGGSDEPDAEVRRVNTRPLTVSTVPRRSWPACALPVIGCPARRWRAGYAVNTRPRSAAHVRSGHHGGRPLRAATKDLVGRRSDTGVLHRVWTSDITYLRRGQCGLYLCAVRDGCRERVIGWAIDEHMRADLVESALAMAVAMRGELAETVIVHADRGCLGSTPARSWCSSPAGAI